MKKDTADLLEELKSCNEFTCFYRENEEELLKKEALSLYLGRLVEKHGIKKSEAIRRSELSEVYAYQIFSGIRVPERKKLLSLAIGMALPLDEIQSLLKCTGYAPLYAKDPFDCIIIFGICKKLSVADINFILFDYEMETLG
ncbi:MAG: XRE family transcriptional regulator [Clostridia bacterium]|nr:XRE family transcriptional regulator [Clostridia bacterium]